MKVKTKPDNGITELMKAASLGDLGAVQSLISAGAGLNEQDIFGHTALSYAVRARHADVVQLLLNSGADVYVKKSYWQDRS